MSRQVTVDYEGLTIRIQAECDTAIHSLCKIDKTIERIHETANKLESEKIIEYEHYLQESKKTIQNKINDFKTTLSKYQELKKFFTDNQSSRYNEFLKTKQELERQSSELTDIVNDLTGSKLAVIDQMIDEGLLNVGKVLLDKANGVLYYSQDLLNKINQIEDVSLRELAYRELINSENSELSFEEILSKAQREYDLLLNKKTESAIAEIKEDLKSSGINEEVLNKVKTIDEANKVANELITDEKIRKETLKVIIKAIKTRGFIVDIKNNLKIDKERNVVKLVALKASGQMAEFEIQINGKFMYHFDEYEGHACKKDIEPFLEDLKNIYDINVLHEEVNWENPDKIQTQKYQYVNVNKNKK